MTEKTTHLRKICVVCGRPMTWRRKWALSWQGVKYCSERCRKARKKPEAPPAFR